MYYLVEDVVAAKSVEKQLRSVKIKQLKNAAKKKI
jgi:hypothetical protein